MSSSLLHRRSSSPPVLLFLLFFSLPPPILLFSPVLLLGSSSSGGFSSLRSFSSSSLLSHATSLSFLSLLFLFSSLSLLFSFASLLLFGPIDADSILDELVVSYKKMNKHPDLLLMGSGVWHMLHVNNASDFGYRLKQLSSHVESLVPFSPKEQEGGISVSGRLMHLFWIGMPVLINGMLNSDEKKENMSDTVWHQYDRSLGESKILRQMGGLLILLDIQSFTWNCGPQCTLDGMHYDSAVYDAAVHVMLNALLIESHQTL